MSYKISHNQFIWVKFLENHKAEVVKDFISEIIKKYPKEQRSRILVDTRGAEVEDKIHTIGELMKSFEILGVDKRIKIAVIRTQGEGKYHEFMKKVGSEDGYNLTLFTCLEEAITWLNQIGDNT
ncbi:MAG: hypothetical protein KAG61_08925 [Bacteriovoracaceae bacterium]|nr:hypothetical protein [Bacteriovoracaceae bacterium]